MKELTEVLQRQKTRVAALQKDRAGMSAQLAAYQPAEQDKLRAEMNTLRERVGELAGIKVGIAYLPKRRGFATSVSSYINYDASISQYSKTMCLCNLQGIFGMQFKVCSCLCVGVSPQQTCMWACMMHHDTANSNCITQFYLWRLIGSLVYVQAALPAGSAGEKDSTMQQLSAWCTMWLANRDGDCGT